MGVFDHHPTARHARHQVGHALLGVGENVVGTIGGGKSKPTGKIDIAVMQSLSRQGEVSELVEDYGQVIVDECHHVGALSFEAILKRTKAKYVMGLTATPIRRDGQQPIIFMQRGPIRHTAKMPQGVPRNLGVVRVPGTPGSTCHKIRAFRMSFDIWQTIRLGPRPYQAMGYAVSAGDLILA